MPHVRSAIIDIGSNSVRLVVYGAPARAPAILFNEKVTAGLGAGLAANGRLSDEAIAATLRALVRFAALTKAMGIDDVRTVATAAVREAANGAAFLDRARDHGVAVELLDGEAEAEAAGLGVISAIPDADGVVGDLGGGSLELVRVKNGAAGARLSLPLGVLRLAAIRKKGHGGLDRMLARALAGAGWGAETEGLPLYLVGGSWRALARLHMSLTDYPLPVLHHYAWPPEHAARLVRVVARIDRKRLRAIAGLPSTRIPVLGDAAALLAVLARRLRSDALIVSASGLREGLLYQRLDADVRGADPLIAATREAGARMSRFDEHGDVLDGWIAPLFGDEPSGDARLRHAACLLGDVAWAANPDFRAERGLEVALHGNWTGIDARGRAMVAHALWTSFDGAGGSAVVEALTGPNERDRAKLWGQAMRLGQRLSGGVAAPLERSRLRLTGDAVVLSLDEPALYGDAVERRHKALASALGREARLA